MLQSSSSLGNQKENRLKEFIRSKNNTAGILSPSPYAFNLMDDNDGNQDGGSWKDDRSSSSSSSCFTPDVTRVVQKERKLLSVESNATINNIGMAYLQFIFKIFNVLEASHLFHMQKENDEQSTISAITMQTNQYNTMMTVPLTEITNTKQRTNSTGNDSRCSTPSKSITTTKVKASFYRSPMCDDSECSTPSTCTKSAKRKIESFYKSPAKASSCWKDIHHSDTNGDDEDVITKELCEALKQVNELSNAVYSGANVDDAEVRTALINEKKELESKLIKATDEIDTLSRSLKLASKNSIELESVLKQKKDLEEKLSFANKEIEDLAGTLKIAYSSSTQTSSSGEENISLEQYYEAMQQIKRLNDEVSELKVEKDLSKAKIAGIEREKRDITLEKEQLQIKKSEFEELLERAMSDLQTVSEVNEDLATALEEVSEEKENALHKIKELAALDQTTDALDKEFLFDENQRMKKELQETTELNNGNADQVKLLLEQLKVLTEENKKLEQTVVEREEQTKQELLETTELSNSNADQVKLLLEQLKTLTEENLKLEQTINEKEKEKSMIVQEKVEKDLLRDENNRLKSSNGNNAAQVKLLLEENQKLQDKIKTFEESAQNLDNLDTLLKERDSAQEDLVEALKVNADATKQLEILESQNKQLTRDLQNVKDEISCSVTQSVGRRGSDVDLLQSEKNLLQRKYVIFDVYDYFTILRVNKYCSLQMFSILKPG